MSLPGTIIRLASGKLAIECVSTQYNEPKQIRHVWDFDAYRLSGMSYCREDDAIGKPATIQDGRISCYLGQGNYLSATLAQGGSTKAVLVEVTDIAPPKTRAGTEIRWRDGRWQKYSTRKGWVAA